MQEAQRFLRYVVPGLIFFIEILIYLLLSGDICFSQLIEQVNPIGIAISGFLASGGLGFLLGVIYYTVVWQEEEPRWIITWPRSRIRKIPIPWLWKKAARLGKKLGVKLGADLRPVLQEAKGWLNLSCCNNGVETTDLSKRGAWRVVISYLNMRMKTSKRIEGAIRRIDGLSNLMNGLGTTFLASFAALVLFVIYHLIRCIPLDRYDIVSVVVGLIILLIHYWNYKGVIRDYESVCASVLKNEFECEFYNKSILGSPIKLYVFQNDLKKDV